MALRRRATAARLTTTGSLRGCAQPDELARQVRAIDRVGEEEAQRRHDAVHGRHGNAVILLPDLEPAQIVRCRRIRRSAKEACEPSDIAGSG